VDLGLRDKAFVIIGGTAGMGLAAGHVLAADGSSVAVVGRDEARGKEAAGGLSESGAAEVYSLAYDVSSPGQAVAAVDEAVGLLGRLDGIAITMGTAAGHHAQCAGGTAAPYRDQRLDRHHGRVLGTGAA
jgi:NAD(P)-dependent dehydrogenase (short-subunit alcohol dehydrogenase family)